MNIICLLFKHVGEQITRVPLGEYHMFKCKRCGKVYLREIL